MSYTYSYVCKFNLLIKLEMNCRTFLIKYRFALLHIIKHMCTTFKIFIPIAQVILVSITNYS